MGYISRYLKVFRACGEVIGPNWDADGRKWWDCRIGQFLFKFWQKDSNIGRQQWLVPTPPLVPFWGGLDKVRVFKTIAIAGYDLVDLTGNFYGRLLVHSWDRVELLVGSYLYGPGYWTSIAFNDPVAVRLWGDYLLDKSVKPFLCDYLCESSDKFADWFGKAGRVQSA